MRDSLIKKGCGGECALSSISFFRLKGTKENQSFCPPPCRRCCRRLGRGISK